MATVIAVCAALVPAATGAAVAAARPGSPAAHVSTPPQARVFLLGLRQRGNPAQLATAVSDPTSRQYRRFLTLAQYRQRFSASSADRRRVLRYLSSQRGVLQVQLSSDQSVVLAVLTQQAGARLFCARGPEPPMRGLCRPPALRGLVPLISASELYTNRARRHGGLGGPDDPPAGVARTCAGAAKTHTFTPQQLSTAYGVDQLHSRGLEGAGVRIATLSGQEVGTAQFRTWAQCFGLRAPVVRQFAMPGATRDASSAPDETVLDVEALASLAPGLARITPIFVPLDLSFTNSFVLFMFGALDPSRQGGNLPDILSISDGNCEQRFTHDQLILGQRFLTQAAALGITTLAASGDLGFQGCFVFQDRGVMFPGSSPFATSVGGTDLTLAPGNQISAQDVWSTYATQPAQGAGSGGGPSQVWGRPSFQRAPGIGPQLQRGRPTRLVPDIAAMASFKPGLAVFGPEGEGWGPGGGTSAATPLEAGIIALVLQQERTAGRPPLGSLSPLLYQLGRGAGYSSIFFDVVTGTSSRKPKSAVGKTPAGGAAQPGYDLATGLGSLKAGAFAAAVASLDATRRP